METIDLRTDDNMSTMIIASFDGRDTSITLIILVIRLDRRRCAKSASSLIFVEPSVRGTSPTTSSEKKINDESMREAIINSWQAADTESGWSVERYSIRCQQQTQIEQGVSSPAHTHTRIHAHRWMLLLLLSDAISLCDKMHEYDITLRSYPHEHRNKKQMGRRNWKINELPFYLIEKSFTVCVDESRHWPVVYLLSPRIARWHRRWLADKKRTYLNWLMIGRVSTGKCFVFRCYLSIWLNWKLISK